MIKLQQIQELTLAWFLSLVFFLSPAHGVYVPKKGNKPDCATQLMKMVPHALAPKGDELQQKYFKVIDEVAAELSGTEEFISPVHWRKRTAKSGLQSLDLPEEVGGKNLPASQMLKIFEYAGRYDLNLRDVPGGGHGRALIFSKNPEHKKIMEQIARGEGYMAIAITEPEHGTDIRGMESVAKKVEGGYEISGEKKYQARLDTASHIIILTKAPSESGKTTKLNAFVVPADYPGLKFKELNRPALRGNSFGGVSFDKLFIPESFRIGGDGEGGKLFNEHFTYWRLMQTSAAIGTAKKALDMTADRIRSRKVNENPIGSMTHLQQELGRASIRLNQTTAMLREAAEAYDRGDFAQAAQLASGAKALGIEDALKAVSVALGAHGAYGMSETDLLQRHSDIQALTVADGATDVLISDYVRKTFGQDLWDMAFGAKRR